MWKIMTRVFCAGALAVFAMASATAETTPKIVCGGGTQNEFTAMMDAKDKHSVLILYVAKDARYLSDVETRIDTADGKPVLEHAHCGPLVLVDVAAGRYKVNVRHQGVAQSREIELKPKGGDRLMFLWE